MKLDWDRKGRWLGLALLLLLSIGLWIAFDKRLADASILSPVTSLPQKESIAPDFTLKALEGSTITLSDLRGQVILINFWATWCPPCREEMIDFHQVYNQYRDQGFVVLAVNQRETAAQVSAFADELGLTFPLLLDTEGDVAAQYRVRALPTTFFVDRSGVIREVIVGGPLHQIRIEDQVTSLLAQSSRSR